GRGHGPTVGAGLAPALGGSCPALGGSCPARRTPPPPPRGGASTPSRAGANGLPAGALGRVPGPLVPVLVALLFARVARGGGRGHGPTVGAGLAPALGGSCPARRTPPPPLRAGTSPPSGEEANGLPLGVLRRFAGPLEPVLLALLLARVAREEAGLLQDRPQL